jgi:ribonucleoside-triphosphate reductase
MNRLIQDNRDLSVEIDKIQKYQVAYRKLMEEYEECGMMPVYSSKMITLDKQFLTIGINGMVEAAESLGIKVGNNDEYKYFVTKNLKIIFDSNKEAKLKYGYMFNTEFVPAENLGVKNAKWDSSDGYKVARECYNSYFYVVEDESINMLDKFILHGNEIIQYLDGGSALHLNLEEYTTQKGFEKLINIAAKTGCNYFCFNIKVTICNNCDNIDKHTRYDCIKCGSSNIDYATRVIGYLKKVTNFSSNRQKEHDLRYYHLKQ